MIQLADGIRRHGFKKWYERELLRGHAHLVAVIVCTLGLMMALEAAMRFRSTFGTRKPWPTILPSTSACS